MVKEKMMPSHLNASFDEIMGEGEKEYFVSAKYADVIPNAVDVVALPRLMPSHHWMVFFIPNTGNNIEKMIKSLEDMDVVTWAWTSCNDLRVFAFINKTRKVPRWLLRCPHMTSITE